MPVNHYHRLGRLTLRLGVACAAMAAVASLSPRAEAQVFDPRWTGAAGAPLRELVERFYTDVFKDDEKVKRLFDRHYVQRIDGEVLDFDGLVKRVQALRKTTRSIHVTVIDAVYDDGLLADRHQVHIVKNNGESLVLDVHAFVRIRAGHVVEINELTRDVTGQVGLDLSHDTRPPDVAPPAASGKTPR